jgi:hypothetical protein
MSEWGSTGEDDPQRNLQRGPKIATKLSLALKSYSTGKVAVEVAIITCLVPFAIKYYQGLKDLLLQGFHPLT